MIKSDEQMQVNLDLIESMYHAIARLRREIAPLNYRNYEIMAEGPIEQIRRLRQEIDDYLGVRYAQDTGAESGAAIESEQHAAP
ncbi:MAG: hypothetical protein L0211_09615 [Planctomycetaceae bacterium]|nr:hypothetical protein [Planctomycetaceae bacterium]